MKVMKRISVVIVVGLIFGIIGLLVGAYLGGNYGVDFTFNGVRGYEAMGQLGFLIGFIGSLLLCGLFWYKPVGKLRRKPNDI